MSRHIIALLLCAASTRADYVVDWRGGWKTSSSRRAKKSCSNGRTTLIHLRDDPVDRAGLVRLRLRRGDKRRRGDVVAAARRVLKRFAADEHTYVEVENAASPKSVITQSRAVSAFSGPFTGISCRPCKN